MTLTKKDYQKMFNTLTPYMQKKLIAYAEKLEKEQQFLKDHTQFKF